MLTLAEAVQLRAGHRLVFTNGVFDILHAGHVLYLEQARNLGDMLFVGLNSDASAKLLGKGPGRPVNTAEDRAEVLSALRAVDGVIEFDEATPIRVIQALRPDIHVKGGDYLAGDLPETPIVHGYGGEVVILPFLPGRSTTAVLKALGIE
jgi:rfaE bifunctional protein nucleotidyltransferase chain/domain